MEKLNCNLNILTHKRFITGDTAMTSLRTMLYATISAAMLMPLGLNAQMLEEEGEALAPVYASEAEIGIGYNTEDSYKFGKFNGLEDDGAFFIGNFDLRKARPAGDNSRDYWELSGTNLGLDSRNAYGEYTVYGSYSLYFDFDQRVNNLIDDGQTPFIGAGSPVLTLPAGWTSGNGVGSLPDLLDSLQPLTIEKDRKKYGGGGSWDISDLWQISANYHHEDKEGTDEFGAVFGSSGGNPRSSIVPIPHDFAFDEFDVGLAFKGAKGQLSITYNLSIFDNEIDSFRFTNPFTNGQWPAASSFPAVGQTSNIFPDNEAWSVNLSGGWNWSPRTRLTGNFSYGEMTQDEAFLPYTSIAALGGGSLSDLPRASLDGEIKNIFANVNLTHRLTNGLNLKARFTYDDRDNSTPRDVYERVAGDSQLQSSGTHRYNRPYSIQKMKFEFDADYRLPYMSKLSAGYGYEEIDRTLQERAMTEEHRFHVKLNTAPVDWASAWVKFTHAARDGGGNAIPQFYQDIIAAVQAGGFSTNPSVINNSDYFSNLPFLEGEAPDEVSAQVAAFLANPTSGAFGGFFENDPLVRKYYMSDRDRNQFSVNANFYPTQELVLSVSGNYIDDDYGDNPNGLRYSKRSNLTFDAGYSPSDRFSGHAFFTVEKNDYEQRSYARAGSHNATISIADRVAAYGNNFWQVFTEDSVYTTGMGFDWEAVEDKFDLSLDLTYSDAVTDIEPMAENIDTATRLPEIIPFPDVETRIFRIMLEGDYKLKDGWGTRMYYWYERFNSTDFANDSIEVATLAQGGTGGNVILLGNSTPTYNANVIGFTLYRKF
jgi:hypothetical protein